ncbi:MAG TPA: aminopeptidase [Burkholderiales bacterium]|nr:aminopeptidase [Burkholderiales bacterium]
MRAAQLTVAAVFAVTAAGCSNIGYYMQSVRGQFDIWMRERPIDALMRDPEVSAELKTKLTQVQEMRRFASTELKLPENDAYTRYADLGRPFVLWNVFAAPEFSLQPMQWCFPFAGCVSYRGYFAREAAERFAAGLTSEGKDTYVGGVPAYSTLGWFADPVLNTFIHYPDYRIAQLIFHELAHREVYAQNDTVFNESFAVVVQEAGVRRWLERRGTPAERERQARESGYRDQFVALVRRYHHRLSELYASDMVPADMRKRKEAIISEMISEYHALKEQWNGFSGYDAWFARRPNNAQIASVALYTRLVPAFRALLDKNGGDLPRFYAAVKNLANQSKDERTASLESLSPDGT